MRNFVAIIAIAVIIGIFAAHHELGVNADSFGTKGSQRRVSFIVPQPIAGNIAINLALPEPKPPINLKSAPFLTELSATNVIAVDNVTDAVLYEKNSDEAHPLASISKLMSALIIIEHIENWNATTTVAVEDIAEGNQAIVAGEVYTMQDLFNAALVGSYNTAINVLVRASNLTQLQFVDEMNQRAIDLGMHKMHFVEPTGLSPENVASARDVARLTKIVLSEPHIKIKTVTQSVTITDLKSRKKKIVKATDWFLNDTVTLKSASVEGGKTGYIPESGYNFTVELKNKDGHEIRVVILGAKDVFARFTEAAAVADWVYENFGWEE